MASFVRRPHAFVLFSFACMWMVLVFCSNNWVLSVALLIASFSLLRQSFQSIGRACRQIIVVLPFLCLYAVFGDSVTRAVRLLDFIAFMMTVSRWLVADDVLLLVSRKFSRLSLTLAMALHFFPQFLAERDRIFALNALRQPAYLKTTLSKRLSRTSTLYRTLLQGALARSWQLAESMYVRGYGTPTRSRYPTQRWRQKDTLRMVELFTFSGCALCSIWFVTQVNATYVLFAIGFVGLWWMSIDMGRCVRVGIRSHCG